MFPEEHGLKYDQTLDEYSMPFEDGIIIIWEKVKADLWELSYVDSDEYQFFLKKGTQEEVEDTLKSFIRDKKIDTILS
jgi:hypothetical protein